MRFFNKVLSTYREVLNRAVFYDGISEKNIRYGLLLIVLSTAFIRIATINEPAIDRTAWKEIDYIMVSENYYRHGYDFLRPEVSWPAEEPRATAMEFPLVPYVAALFYSVLGVNVYSIRLLTLLAFLLLIVYVYKLVRREMGAVLALGAAFFTAIIPLFHSHQNMLHSEPLMIFLSVFSIFHFAEWVDFRKTKNLIGFVIGYSLTIALKPTALYLLLPLSWIFFRKHRFQWRAYGTGAVIVLSTLILPVLWYYHAYHLARESIDVFGIFGGQFGGHDKFQTLAMLSNPDWYLEMYWRLKLLMFGEFGFLFVGLGLLAVFWLKRGILFAAYMAAILCFIAIVAEGHIDASYRQLTIIPPAAFLLAMGTATCSVGLYVAARSIFQLQQKKGLATFSFLFSLLLLAVFPIRKPYTFLPNEKEAPCHLTNWELAREIRKVAGEKDTIILAGEYTIHKGGNDLSPVTYYYSGLSGWTIQQGQWEEAVINELRRKGASLFGAVSYWRELELEKFLESLKGQYPVLYEDSQKGILLLDLRSGPLTTSGESGQKSQPDGPENS